MTGGRYPSQLHVRDNIGYLVYLLGYICTSVGSSGTLPNTHVHDNIGYLGYLLGYLGYLLGFLGYPSQYACA